MTIALTQYSHGAGCGCKISPALLDSILQGASSNTHFPGLLVGHSAKDDAAAFDLGDGRSVLSTTDFFMPIVDDPFTFGQIAATNAISDIYAMGGKPLMAIAIFGWPIDKLDAQVGSQVIAGGRSVCEAAGIPLAGGHSIDAPEPIFGLAVTGLVENRLIKTNSMAEPDCELFLTKPLGVGILTTAQKQQKISPADLQHAIDSMCQLNAIGAVLSSCQSVKVMTDVTGFGLLGHLIEVCEASQVSATIDLSRVPLLPNVEHYLAQGCVPGGTGRNWQSFGHKVAPLDDNTRHLLCDPQTSGGLLVMVKREGVDDFHQLCAQQGVCYDAIGMTHARTDENKPWVEVSL